MRVRVVRTARSRSPMMRASASSASRATSADPGSPSGSIATTTAAPPSRASARAEMLSESFMGKGQVMVKAGRVRVEAPEASVTVQVPGVIVAVNRPEVSGIGPRVVPSLLRRVALAS